MGFLAEHLPFIFAPGHAALSETTARAHTAGRIVVLGIGNVQWGDAGFGVRALERLKSAWQCAPHVECVDGGTQGRALLPLVESAQRMIVFNAADFGASPGTLCVRAGDAATAHLRTRAVNLHQMDFADALACAQLKGRYPRELVLIGVQPIAHSDYGADLRPAVRAQLDPAVAAACRWLRRWHARPQALSLPHGEALTARAGCADEPA
ncbi:HyaD/HybD family hydrogenase maturation endopeptidase [Paraburkholderia sp.]|uniref:HyaD/HybD family hydrogenase maturation endopeptidase n=1 Tax=Paraburkholderia sp. TaxID=1926495 RepID=UPI00286FAAED|nr:HyaD/HybD family hydrogenase maturation endopeptidase [Paraburkholderia sp.]